MGQFNLGWGAKGLPIEPELNLIGDLGDATLDAIEVKRLKEPLQRACTCVVAFDSIGNTSCAIMQSLTSLNSPLAQQAHPKAPWFHAPNCQVLLR